MRFDLIYLFNAVKYIITIIRKKKEQEENVLIHNTKQYYADEKGINNVIAVAKRTLAQHNAEIRLVFNSKNVFLSPGLLASEALRNSISQNSWSSAPRTELALSPQHDVYPVRGKKRVISIFYMYRLPQKTAKAEKQR